MRYATVSIINICISVSGKMIGSRLPDLFLAEIASERGTVMNIASCNIHSPSEWESMIAEIRESIRRPCCMYHRGLLAGDDRDRRVDEIISKAINPYRESVYSDILKIRIAASDWACFIREISDWKEDHNDAHLEHYSWLSYDRDIEEKNIRHGDEATVSDKKCLLKLFSTFHTPLEYYRPVPADIIRPDIYLSHDNHWPFYWFVGFGIWEKDEGLAHGIYQIGETKTLVDHCGLKATIRIDRHIREDEKSRYLDCDYIGTGTIEGYTSSRKREIKIYLDRKNNRIGSLLFRAGDDDHWTEYPMWKPYCEDRAEISRIYQQIIADNIADY